MMRILFTITFLYSFVAKSQTIYYVSNNGNDVNNGTSTSTSWQTLTKAFTSAPSGSTIKANMGDTWVEQIVPATSNIQFTSYGTGVKPSVTALKTVTGWSNVGNIWSATILQSVSNQKLVIINGQQGIIARQPNTGYLTATSIVDINQIAIPHTITDYTGADLVSTPQIWVIDVSRIRNKSNGTTSDTLTLDSTREDGLSNRYYFYQNRKDFLDTINEYIYNDTTKVISVYATSQPNVQYSVFDTLVNIHKKNNIVFDGITLSGGNSVTVFMDSSRYDTLRNCTIDYSGFGVSSNMPTGLAIVNDSIQHSLSGGYFTFDDSALYVYQNYINKSGLYAGMGGNGFSTYGGGFSYSTRTGAGAIIRDNQIKNSGYHGFRFVGQNTVAEYNDIDSFCLTKDDGGGIYTFVGTGNAALNTGSEVRYNYISNGIGTAYGKYAVGLYFDDGVNNISGYGNTFYKAGTFASIQTKGQNNIIRDNISIDSVAINVYTKTSNLTFKNNILYNNNTTGIMYRSEDNLTDASMDSNYYLMQTSSRTFHLGATNYRNLQDWRVSFANYDSHSKDISQLPNGITSSTPILVVNKSMVAQDIALSGSYYDAKGVGYENSIYLLPFRSALLFPSNYKKPITITNLRFKY